MTAGPGRPAYLDTPYESPARFGANGVPLPPLNAGPEASFNFPPPEQPSSAPKEIQQNAYQGSDFARSVANAPVDRPRGPSFQMVEEKPVSPETTEALLQAIHKVFRVATARIKYHEAEAARLRAALAPFAGLAGPVGGVPVAPPSAESTLRHLVEAVRLLPELETTDAQT